MTNSPPPTEWPEERGDDFVYLGNELDFERPKENFKRLIELIQETGAEKPLALVDVGCAAGAFLFHASRALDLDPRRTVGLDLGERLLGEARRRVPEFRFVHGSIEDPHVLEGEQFDVCTSIGVAAQLDDLEPGLAGLVRLTRPGGTVLVFDTVNDDPVDVVMRYRRADDPDAAWQPGFNVHSRATYNRLLARLAPAAEVDYIPFQMPFAVPKGDDPLRAWTIATADNPHQVVVGTRQLLTFSIVRIRLPDPS